MVLFLIQHLCIHPFNKPRHLTKRCKTEETHYNASSNIKTYLQYDVKSFWSIY